MRLLITGAAGFIGGHVLRAAIKAGHDVLGLVRKKNNPSGEKYYCEGALAEPPWKTIEEFRPDRCLHAAWHAKPGAFWDADENEHCVRDSVDFIRALGSGTGCHVVVTGTCAEYAPSRSPLSEADSPLRPESGYARAKQALHEELLELSAASELSLGWARIFYPYGPGEPAAKVTTALLHAAMRDEELVLRQPQSIKDFIYIEEAANALLGLLENRSPGVVNIASGCGMKIDQLAEIIVKLVGRGRIVLEPSETPDPLSPMIGDVTRLRQSVPSLKSIDLETGLEFLRRSLLHE